MRFASLFIPALLQQVASPSLPASTNPIPGGKNGMPSADTFTMRFAANRSSKSKRQPTLRSVFADKLGVSGRIGVRKLRQAYVNKMAQKMAEATLRDKVEPQLPLRLDGLIELKQNEFLQDVYMAWRGNLPDEVEKEDEVLALLAETMKLSSAEMAKLTHDPKYLAPIAERLGLNTRNIKWRDLEDCVYEMTPQAIRTAFQL